LRLAQDGNRLSIVRLFSEDGHLRVAALAGNAQSISASARCLVTWAALAFFMTGCGTASQLKCVQIVPNSTDLIGIGATQQLAVFAVFSDGRQFDVTSQATFSVAQPNPLGPVTPPNVVEISGSAQVESIGAACTWTSTMVGTTTTFATSPYLLTATYKTLSDTAFISVASSAGCNHP